MKYGPNMVVLRRSSGFRALQPKEWASELAVGLPAMSLARR